MTNKIKAIMPFAIMPIFIPIYTVLDNLVFVEVFGCGCVPSAQTNMFNISFNANDLRLTVFSVLTISLSLWSVFLSKRFDKQILKFPYCFAVAAFNLILMMWVIKTFMWQ